MDQDDPKGLSNRLFNHASIAAIGTSGVPGKEVDGLAGRTLLDAI